ncbi:MAG: alpha-mannosidase, partial [Methylacidiphilales bacterium]|nr:alpha-mannosidase [Candidatus Methylacidiphilales bacterium]
MKKIVFHLLANAHLDPVWLWDWREGLNEGIITTRTMLDLMDEDPKLTFMRGEAAIYQHIQEQDPATFARIQERVREGRWDVVGGTYIQPDTNLSSTETMARHFTVAQNYFRAAFGRAPRVAWAADSFGHSGGLPEIMAGAGITGFAFTRPESHILALEHPAFWWESASGAKVLAYRPTVGWYGTNRDEVFRRFDGQLELNEKFPAQNIGFFYGVGNHGGGATRRQLDDIRSWVDKHPGVEVVHSGLHRFFDELAAEEKERKNPYPVHRGELNFCLRGCYVSVAKFKFPYRRTEAQLVQSEKTDAIISASLNRPAQDLSAAWKSVLFNSFHDILPGTSIERAFEDQLAWLGSAYHDAQRVQLNALNALAARVDTTVPKPEGDHPSRVAFLVWNPHPHEYSGPVELEASLDYRPLFQYEDRPEQVPVELFGPEGRPVPFQIIHHEHLAMMNVPWRKRVVFQAKLPPMSWSVFQVGLAKKMKKT